MPYLAPRCQVDFKWVELAHHRNGTVDARIDVGGDGVTQGWAVELDFAAKSLPMRALAVSNLVGAVELSSAAGVVVMRPRLASGLGTVLLSVRLPRAWPAGRAPAIRCVREPGAGKVAAEAATEAEEDDDAWLRSARDDYVWMADEFNRQYHNSHGKSHDEYQPHSADVRRATSKKKTAAAPPRVICPPRLARRRAVGAAAALPQRAALVLLRRGAQRDALAAPRGGARPRAPQLVWECPPPCWSTPPRRPPWII